jgi:L-ascorbate metabolism protein UlaG (beta-lactamase superfamily)
MSCPHECGTLGVKVLVVPANHWSARGTRDRNMALWAGYVLRLGRRGLYFAGDTGFGGGGLFRSIGEENAGLDVALLPIGAYEPRWFMAAQHMNPEEAVRAFGPLGARQALGYRWGTFRLTDEGPERPSRDLSVALADQNVDPERFLPIRPGEVWCAS